MVLSWDDVQHNFSVLWHPEVALQLDREIVSYPLSPKGLRVLDLGAGPGHFCAALVRAGAEMVVWQDIDTRFRDMASQRSELRDHVRFELHDMYDLPYPESWFDLIVVRGSLHWAPDERRLIRDLSRITKPGGWLVISSPNYRRGLSALPRRHVLIQMCAPLLAAVLRRKPVTPLFVFESLTRARVRASEYDIVECRRDHRVGESIHPKGQWFQLFARRRAASEPSSLISAKSSS